MALSQRILLIKLTMTRYISGTHTFLNAKGATGAGTPLFVGDCKHILVYIATDGGGDANLTVKCQGSIEDTPPTWASAQSVTNRWEYIYMNDMEDPSTNNIDGDTGFVVAGADDYRLMMVNTDGLSWLNFNVTARSEGEVTVVGKMYSNT